MLSRLLEGHGFTMTDYDSVFFDVPLTEPYDFIFSTECFEHFEEPVLEIMTELRTDPTHVSFYSEKTLDYLYCRS